MREFHRATGWTIDRERRVLHVDWEDGLATEYGFEELRRACPCAMCAGEGGFRGTMTATTALTERQLTLEDVQPVGRYGLAPRWGDGHSTGIYTFKMLRTAAGLAP
jgi:DUF971 family protein